MIHGRLTCLRRIEDSDLGQLLRWQGDRAVMRGWGQAAPLPSRAALERDIAGRFTEFESALYLIIETVESQPIGRLDVFDIDARHRSAEVAMYIGETGAHGKGNGTDALGAVCRYLFEQRGLHRVGLTVMVDNGRAIAVYERLGFRRDGILRRHLWMDGAPVDELVMSLLQGELREIG